MARPSFRQSDVTRAVRGALAAGIDVKTVMVDRHGTISVGTTDPKPEPEPLRPGIMNSWDEAFGED